MGLGGVCVCGGGVGGCRCRRNVEKLPNPPGSYPWPPGSYPCLPDRGMHVRIGCTASACLLTALVLLCPGRGMRARMGMCSPACPRLPLNCLGPTLPWQGHACPHGHAQPCLPPPAPACPRLPLPASNCLGPTLPWQGHACPHGHALRTAGGGRCVPQPHVRYDPNPNPTPRQVRP